MAWKETFSSSSISLKVSMALALLQALVYIIGYSTNCWVAAKAISVNIGSLGMGVADLACLTSLESKHTKVYGELGHACWTSARQVNSVPYQVYYATDWLHVTRLFATLALIGFVVTIVGVFVCLFVTQLSQRRILHILTCVVAASTAVCVLVAVAIYGTNYKSRDQRFLTLKDKDPSWSYGLCVAALILDIITSILLAINALRKPII